MSSLLIELSYSLCNTRFVFLQFFFTKHLSIRTTYIVTIRKHFLYHFSISPNFWMKNNFRSFCEKHTMQHRSNYRLIVIEPGMNNYCFVVIAVFNRNKRGQRFARTRRKRKRSKTIVVIAPRTRNFHSV